MINYGLYSNIVLLLSEMSALTPQLKALPGAYWHKSIEYLEKLQAFADKHNLYFSSDVALTSSKLLTFSDDKISAAVKRNTRRQKDQYAVSCLENLHKEIKSFIEKPRMAFEECSNIWRQVLAQSLARGLLSKMSSGVKLDYIVSSIKTEPELKAYYFHIVGTIGTFNAIAVLDTVMPELEL